MRSFNGSTDKIDLPSLAAAGTISAYSIFCAMRPASVSGLKQAMTFGGGFNWTLILEKNGSNLNVAQQILPSGAVVATGTGVLSAGTVARTGASWDGSDVRLYCDGSQVASVAATTILQNSFNDHNSIGYQARDDVGYFDGDLGEVAFWPNVALTAAEMAALGAGVSPQFIRPQSLYYYFPLIREIIDLRGVATPTVTGTTVADHIRVYRPWRLSTTGLTFPASTTVPTIGRSVEPPAVDAVWQQYLEAHSAPLATSVYLPVPPPPPPPPVTPAPTINPVEPPPIDAVWQEYMESWVHGMRPLKADPLPTLPPTPLPQAGTAGKALLPKDPQADVVTRNFVNRTADMLNSLMTQGRLVQVDGQARKWSLTSGFTALRAPTATDDITTGALPGMTWVNTSAGTAYICAGNTRGAAVWLKLATS